MGRRRSNWRCGEIDGYEDAESLLGEGEVVSFDAHSPPMVERTDKFGGWAGWGGLSD